MAKAPFKLRSGNSTPFKMMGSSPVKKKEITDTGIKDPDTGQVLDYINDRSHPAVQERHWRNRATDYGERSLQSDQPATTPEKTTPKSKPYVKSGGKATGNMKDYAIGSKERYAEYEARGWAHDATTKGGKPTAEQYTTSGEGGDNVDTSKQSVAVGPQTEATAKVNEQEFPTTSAKVEPFKPLITSRKDRRQENKMRKSSGRLNRKERKFETLATKAETALAKGKTKKAERLARRANRKLRKKGVNTTDAGVGKTSDRLIDLGLG